MDTVQPTARLCFYESKPIVTVQRRFRLEKRNCQSPSKNSIQHWMNNLKEQERYWRTISLRLRTVSQLSVS
ncbi:hypothetical protein AVEN_143866-1, partial [Araneus ventricosus]